MSGLSGWIMGYILFQNYYVIFNGEKVNDHKIGLVMYIYNIMYVEHLMTVH